MPATLDRPPPNGPRLFFDAHCHWQDERLQRLQSRWWNKSLLGEKGKALVNGTHPEDWAGVIEWTEREAGVIPFFGVHPWWVEKVSPSGWEKELIAILERFPAAGVGEIGLDKWVRGVSREKQRIAFQAQLEVARELGRPVTIHCLRAFGEVAEMLAAVGSLSGGFLLHAYSGPVELVDTFVSAGAYFSFSPYFCQARKQAARDCFARIPEDRLLVETDAPHMSPGEEVDERNLRETPSGERLNHPANLDLAIDGLAALRGWNGAECAALTWRNGMRWLGLNRAIP